MLERILSPRGFKIYFASVAAMLGFVIWQRFANSGIIAWMDYLQAEFLFSGYYYPELSILIALIPILIVGFAVGLLHDYVTQQGIFADRENADAFANPGSNRKIGYQATARKEVMDQVRSKFQTEIRQLKFMGFEELGVCREIVPWFGAPMGCFGILGALGVLANEITRVGPNLTVNIFTIAMASRKDSTYAAVFNLGVKFYTEFSDGTCLITATNKGIEFQDRVNKIYRTISSGSLASAWDSHKKWVGNFGSDAAKPKEDISMAGYLPLLAREDDYLWKHRSKLSGPDRKKRSFLSETVNIVVSTIVSMGILLGVVSAFMFAGNVMGNLYPSCWFVRQLRNIPLPLNFLAIVACVAASWILARLQNNLLTVNGMGTRLHGWGPTEDSRRFISTKWLVLPGVPLLPVRSYSVTVEGGDRWNNSNYSMQPLARIRWEQVSETVRKSWLGYAVLALLFLAFILWTVAECS